MKIKYKEVMFAVMLFLAVSIFVQQLIIYQGLLTVEQDFTGHVVSDRTNGTVTLIVGALLPPTGLQARFDEQIEAVQINWSAAPGAAENHAVNILPLPGCK